PGLQRAGRRSRRHHRLLRLWAGRRWGELHPARRHPLADQLRRWDHPRRHHARQRRNRRSNGLRVWVTELARGETQMAKDPKCPKCAKPITELKLDAMKASLEEQARQFPAVTFSCPSCRSVLGAQIDPVALMSGTVKGLANAM